MLTARVRATVGVLVTLGALLGPSPAPADTAYQGAYASGTVQHDGSSQQVYIAVQRRVAAAAPWAVAMPTIYMSRYNYGDGSYCSDYFNLTPGNFVSDGIAFAMLDATGVNCGRVVVSWQANGVPYFSISDHRNLYSCGGSIGYCLYWSTDAYVVTDAIVSGQIGGVPFSTPAVNADLYTDAGQSIFLQK